MKVILTEDVEKLGDMNQVVEVADGYARNYLLPRSLALPATKSAMANLDNLKAISDRRQARLKGEAQTTLGQLEGKILLMPARVGAGGKLFGSISASDIAVQLKQQFGVDLDRKQIGLDEPIRQAGLHGVPLKLHREVQPNLIVQVGDAPPGGFAPLDSTPAESAVPTESAVQAEPAEALV